MQYIIDSSDVRGSIVSFLYDRAAKIESQRTFCTTKKAEAALVRAVHEINQAASIIEQALIA